MTVGADSFHSVTAVERVREEKGLVESELAAFRRFEKQIEAVPGTSSSQTGTAEPAGALTVQSGVSPTRKLEHSYRSTVMAVPHYETEYGDTFEESIRTEFDRAIVQVITGAIPYTPLAKSRLLGASETARRNRSALVEDLDRELAALSVAISRLEAWDEQLDHVHERIDTWPECRASEVVSTIERIRAECDARSAERQQRIHRHATGVTRYGEPDTFVQYLYGRTEFSMPILADISSIGHRLDRERSRLGARLTG